MKLEDLRVACETCHGSGLVAGVEPRSWKDCLSCEGAGYRPITPADLEGLGEKIDWCVAHSGTNPSEDYPPDDCTLCAYTELGVPESDCRWEKKILIAPQESLVGDL